MVWVQIIPTRETAKLESAISTWTPSALSSIHRSNYKPLVSFDVLPFNHLSIPSIPLIICSPKYYIRPRSPNLTIQRSINRSSSDFLRSTLSRATTRCKWNQWKFLHTRWHFAFAEFDGYCRTVIAIPRLICFHVSRASIALNSISS